MRGMITPERLAGRVCRALDVPAKDNAESITEMLRTALSESRDRSIAAAKTVCLEIAEDDPLPDKSKIEQLADALVPVVDGRSRDWSDLVDKSVR